MRLVCAGDLHLGAGSEFGAPGERLGQQAQAWMRACEAANEADAMLCTGDAFHRRTPTPAEYAAWQQGIERLQVPILAIPGNHDVLNADTPSSLLVANSWGQPYRTLATEPMLCQLGDVDVVCLPWTTTHRLRVTAPDADPAETLLSIAQGLRARAREDVSVICLAHWSITGSSLPNGLAVDDLGEVVLDHRELAQAFDLVVAGHIHRPQRWGIDERVNIIYTGSLATVDWGETSVDHGWWIAEGPDDLHYQADSDPARFATFDLGQVIDTPHAVKMLTRAAFDEDVEDPIVRVRYSHTPDVRIDVEVLRDQAIALGAKLVHQIQPTVIRSQRGRVAGLDESVDLLAAVRLWADANPPPEGVDLITETRERMERL